MIETLAAQIAHLTHDYHCDIEGGYRITPAHVVEWVQQFDEQDRAFILSELCHLLGQGIYIQRVQAKELLLNLVKGAAQYYKYGSEDAFLNETQFICLQPDGKSQCVLLELLNEVLVETFNKPLEQCGILAPNNYIYIDDVLATGKTFVTNIADWLGENNRLEQLKSGQIKFMAYFFCTHTWGVNTARYMLKMKTGEDFFLDAKKFVIHSKYKVENNIKGFNEKLNLLYPQTPQPDFDIYLGGLAGIAKNHRDRAYRPLNMPSTEHFFSSKENRIRLETIFVQKGIEIINRIQDEQKRKNHRPLGKTYPSYHTFGTGTMFFTWRNISNTCPIVLWWNNPAHHWKGLFPLFNRGIH